MKKVSLPRGLVYVRSQHTFTATWISLNRENFDVVGISKMRIELIVLQISRLSEGSTGQIFATSSVIYQMKMWGL